MKFDSTQVPTTAKFLDLTGHRYGRLMVRGYAGKRREAHFWHAICDCGNEAVVWSGSIRNGSTSSCGCLHKERFKYVTHGLSRTPEYNIWRGMKARCLNPAEERFRDYGGRGIAICSEWKDGADGLGGFEVFLRDMGPRPSPKHSLDRVDVDGDYRKSNCRWATDKEQGRNTRNNRPLTCDGRTMLMIEWAEERGINYRTIKSRLDQLGWTIAQALGFEHHPKRRAPL